MTDRSFNEQRPVCLEDLFDQTTGLASKDFADLICHHVIHSDCVCEMGRALNHDGKRYGVGGCGIRVGCPTCGEGTSEFQFSKDIGFFPAYWVPNIENVARMLHPNPPYQPVKVEQIRTVLQQDATIPEPQKQYLREENFKKALEWEGKIRYGGQRIYSFSLFTRGIFKYDENEKTVWLWEWGVAPGTLCKSCGNPAFFACPGCHLRVTAPYYCCALCRERHSAIHKRGCEMFQSESTRGAG